MTVTEILEGLRRHLPGLKLEELKKEKGDPWIEVAPANILRVLQCLRDDLDFTYLACLTGFDEGSGFGVAYHLRSLTAKSLVTIRTKLPRENPSVASATSLFAAANWFERETFDLLGIGFENHPDLRRLLMPDDWIGHPLRKDYQPPGEYHGLSTERPDAHTVLDPLYPQQEEKGSAETA